jgi:tRNA(Arg) A34 adenosine deaminase TadA
VGKEIFCALSPVPARVIGVTGAIGCKIGRELHFRAYERKLTAVDPILDPWDRAFAEARAASARDEAPIGACLVKDGTILASAGNRTLQDRDPTAHAEMLVIRAAARKLGVERLTGCDLYVTLEPCAMCAGAVSHARLRRLYYAAEDEKGGAVDNGPRFFAQKTCHHRPEIYGGIRAGEAAEILRGFFKARR